MPPVAIGLAAAGAASGIAGAVASNNAANTAKNTARKGQQAFQDLNLPNIEDQKLQLQMLQQQGLLTPELEQAISEGKTNLADIQMDPKLRQAQMDALGTLNNIGQSQGMDPQARAAFEQARNQAESSARGAREASMQNAAQRGLTGSGVQLASELAADQAEGNQLAQSGFNEAAAANQRKMDAINSMANLGGQVRNQDFSQAATTAQAQDAIDRFNAANSQAVQSRNVAYGNQAQQANLAERQRIADQNTGLSNSQQQYNKELFQKDYQNRYQQAQGIAGQAANVANAQLAGGQAVAGALGGLGQAGIGAAGAIYANQKQPKNPNDPTAVSY